MTNFLGLQTTSCTTFYQSFLGVHQKGERIDNNKHKQKTNHQGCIIYIYIHIIDFLFIGSNMVIATKNLKDEKKRS